jgi:hypothetical protein
LEQDITNLFKPHLLTTNTTKKSTHMRFLEGIKLQTPLNRESIPRERPISSLRHEERKQHSDIHGRDQLRASFHDREESDMHATNTGKGEETRWWGIAEEAVEGEGDGLAEAEAGEAWFVVGEGGMGLE